MGPRTLTERLERVEQVLIDSGIACDLETCSQQEREMAQAQFNQRESRRAHGEDKLDMHRERAVRYEDRNECGAQPPSSTAFEEITNRIQQSTDRVLLIASKLEEIGTRVMGSLPESDENRKMAAERSPDGTLEHTFLALNWLDHALDRLHSAAVRLERI